MKQNLLITGGSGFLGRNLAEKLKKNYNVFLASRNNKQNFIAKKITNCEVLPMDVSNIESVRDVFVKVKPSIVIHAAATKFVDLSEKFPLETIDVNVIGSQNIARVAMETGVNIVIGISTDKACPPIRNIYGLSKATMERIFCLLNGTTSTKFTCVRYGNVAWSTGSVLPIWKNMFEKEKKIMTTGPEMRRFFFTIDEAVGLVNTALENIDLVQGQVLSRMMKSVQIEHMLDVWIEMFGGSWEKIEGRPGERNDEYLIGETELDYCEEIMFDNIKHFLISPNLKKNNRVQGIFNSEIAEKLSKNEIISIINAQPDIL